MNEFLRDIASDDLFIQAETWEEQQELLRQLAEEEEPE
jgi:hypothetical protein